MNRGRFKGFILVLIPASFVVVAGACYFFVVSPSVYSSPSQQSAVSSTIEAYFESPNCGTVDYYHYLKAPGQRTASDTAAFSCIDKALVDCSPAHIRLDEDVNDTGETSTVTYGVRSNESNGCRIVVYSWSTNGPRESCDFPSGFFANMWSSRVAPGSTVFAALHVSVQLDKLANARERSLDCSPL